MRLGFEYWEAAWAVETHSIVVVDLNERTEDIVRDLRGKLVCLYVRRYGKKICAELCLRRHLRAIYLSKLSGFTAKEVGC